MLSEDILGVLQETIKDELFQSQHKKNNRSFTRNRILTFNVVFVIILNKISKSINVEVNKFLTKILSPIVSKQAFSKARYNLKASAFKALNKVFLQKYYERAPYKLYKKKYLLLAADGTNLHLPWTEELVSMFGQMDTGRMNHPMCIAKCIKIWDVLNQLNIDSQLYSYTTAEVEMFKDRWLKTFPVMRTMVSHPFILLGDMGFPSFWLLHLLNNQEVKYVFRCKKDFCTEVKEFIQSGKRNSIVKIDMSKYRRKERMRKQGFTENLPEVIEVRIERVFKKTGEESYLISSLEQEELTSEELEKIYELRWGEEVSFYFDKYKMEAENFSAKKSEGIRQEWQAAMLGANIGQLLINDAQAKLDKKQAKSSNKYEYKINKSVALGLIKDELPLFVLGIESYKSFYNRMIESIMKFKEPIRPDRISPRKTKHNLRYHMNRRKIY